MGEKYDEQLLLGYVEGELSEHDQARVEQWMRQDGRLADLVEAMIDQRVALRSVPDPEPPAWVLDEIDRQLERAMLIDAPAERPHDGARRCGRFVRRPVLSGSIAAALALFVGGLIWWSLSVSGPRPELAMREDSPAPGSGQRGAPEADEAAPGSGAETAEAEDERLALADAPTTTATPVARSGPARSAAEDPVVIAADELLGFERTAGRGGGAPPAEPIAIADEQRRPSGARAEDAEAAASELAQRITDRSLGETLERSPTRADEAPAPVELAEVPAESEESAAPGSTPLHAVNGIDAAIPRSGLALRPSAPAEADRSRGLFREESLAAAPDQPVEGQSVIAVANQLKERPEEAEQYELQVVSQDPPATQRFIQLAAAQTTQTALKAAPAERRIAESSNAAVEQQSRRRVEAERPAAGREVRAQSATQAADPSRAQAPSPSEYRFHMNVAAERLPDVIEQINRDANQVRVRLVRRAAAGQEQGAAPADQIDPWPAFRPDYETILRQQARLAVQPRDRRQVNLPVVVMQAPPDASDEADGPTPILQKARQR